MTSRGATPVPPVVSTSAASSASCGDRRRDLGGLVGHDSALDLVAVGGEQLLEHVAALVLARARDDTVRNRQNGRLHASTLVFSTSVTSAMTISLSIAFAMS